MSNSDDKEFYLRVRELFDSPPTSGKPSGSPRTLEPRRGGLGSTVVILGAVVVLVLGVVQIGGRAAVWFAPQSKWAYEWRYFGQTDLDGADFAITPQPHDCEFMTAPIGSKHCQYERQVFTVRVRGKASERVASYDGGRTWARAEASEKPMVYVSWNKIED